MKTPIWHQHLKDAERLGYFSRAALNCASDFGLMKEVVKAEGWEDDWFYRVSAMGRAIALEFESYVQANDQLAVAKMIHWVENHRMVRIRD